MLLKDPTREVFVELNEHDSNYGPSEEELRPLYNGRWLNSLFDDNDKQNDSFDLKVIEPQTGKIFIFYFLKNYKKKTLT